MKFSSITILGAATLAVAQRNAHQHRHAARHASPVEARANVVVEVEGPVVTIYELNGKKVDWEDVDSGLKGGKYVLVGDKISSVKTTTAKKTTTAAPSSTTEVAAKFFEKASSSKPTTTTTTTTTPPPTTTTTTQAPPPTTTTAPKTDSSAPSQGQGVDSEFPSGKVKCSDFPSSYGAIYIEYLKHGGWTGIQRVPGFNFRGDSSISHIDTAIDGEGCTNNSFCSYACPAGYQKSQWPNAQGATAQSIGGLYCNNDGYLELSRDSDKKLCIAGVGGIKVKNTLGQNAAVCRTDYPGTESETIPLNTQPGGEYELCNPDQNKYYQWQGAPTSAQYYVNNAGVPVNEACDWGVAGSNKGNWAPVNLGVGRGGDGNTYISLFPNWPTNDKSVKLNFNIAIKGDISGNCGYKDGNYVSNGNVVETGCTVSVVQNQFLIPSLTICRSVSEQASKLISNFIKCVKRAISLGVLLLVHIFFAF